MMGLRDDFDPTRVSLLNHSPTHSLDAAVKELISQENRWPTQHMLSFDCVLATSSAPSQHLIAPFTTTPQANLPWSSKDSCHEFCHANGNVIFVCFELQKFMQEQEKCHLPHVVAIFPSNPFVPTIFNFLTYKPPLPFLSPQVIILDSLTLHVVTTRSLMNFNSLIKHFQHIPFLFIQLMVLLCLLVINKQSLHLVCPLLTLIIFQSFPSIWFLLLSFVNQEQMFYLLIMLWMYRIPKCVKYFGQAVMLNVCLRFMT